MSATMATSLVNGFAPPVLENTNEVQEYEKILKLRDEIFAGTHPRLTVPAHAIRKVSPLSASTTSVPPPFSVAPQQNQLPGLSINAGGEKQSNTEQNVNNISTVNALVKPTTTSGIDPVLLMKSDELVKAETQLHRQRLEKSLRDQFEQKRLEARRKPAAGEAKPDFDVATVLAKAQEVARPDAVSTPKDDASNNDSSDVNSLYSSKAPDSTPEVGELEDSASSHNPNLSGAVLGANGPAETQHLVSQTDPIILSQRHSDSPNSVVRKTLTGTMDVSQPQNDDDEEEEGEYSPPEATEQFVNAGDSSLQTVVDPRSRPLRRYSELDDNGKRPGSPNDNMRINNRRNGRQNQRGRATSPRQSPDTAGPPSRKKRKLDKKAERRKRNAGGSPDIKDEPVSPPPFHDVQPLGSGRPRQIVDDRPIVIDDGPAREPVRYMLAPDQYPSSPSQPMRVAEPLMPLSEPRVVSRSTMRPMRDDSDLRRVASMHNMRAEMPREYVDQGYDTPTRPRATSYMRVDSPMRVEQPRHVQELSQGYDREANQGVRVVRSPAPTYREVYQGPEPEVRYIPEPMPPPTIERIVVDQYGRRFREIIQDRTSVDTRSYSTFPDRVQPAYYDNYDRGRGQSVMVETRQDPRMAPEMLPPQIVRQAAEPGPSYREVYEPQRSGSVRPTEQSPRQPVYIDERPEYRASVRVGSVRPAGPRYEEMPPPPMAVRAGSVRPGVREGSVFVEDRPQVRREYLPVEAPRYRVVEPETRYIDASGREITYVDGGQDTGPRYVQRY